MKAKSSSNELQHLSPSILIVDDNAMNLNLIRVYLNTFMPKAEIHEANNGKEAIEAVKNQAYEIIFMDIHMPEIDGLEASKQIREYEGLNPNPATIIALTADVQKENQELCLQVGMNDFLAKPIRKDLLRCKLERALLKTTPFEDCAPPSFAPAEIHIFNKAELLEKIGGDAETCRSIVESALSRFQGYMDKLTEAVHSGKPEEIQAAAHAIKGSAANLCFEELSVAAAKIEKAASEDQTELLQNAQIAWERLQKSDTNI